MSKGLRRAVHRHLSAADERFGLRLGAGLVGTLVAAVTFALLLLLVRAGWAPLRSLDTAAAEAFNRIDADQPEMVRAAEVVSDVFDPNVFRVALTVIALVYLIHGERHHATWLVVTVFGGAALGFGVEGDRRPGPPGAAGSGLDGAWVVVPFRPCAGGVDRLLPAAADHPALPAARRPRLPPSSPPP